MAGQSLERASNCRSENSNAKRDGSLSLREAKFIIGALTAVIRHVMPLTEMQDDYSARELSASLSQLFPRTQLRGEGTLYGEILYTF